MTIEIRPVTASEAVDYLRVLPQETGLPIWEPAAAAWYSGQGPWPPPSNPPSDERLAANAETVVGEGFHSQAAFVDGRIVGGSATLSLELTVPGFRQVMLGGVTATGVLPTHRRRGLLRMMITALLEGCRERGEFIAGLSASEGSIYGRYGFSPATFQVRWELERSEAAFDVGASDGDVELVKADVVKAAWPALQDRVRRQRVGEIGARRGRWNGLSDTDAWPGGPLRYLVHRGTDGDIDGIAHFRTPWSDDPAFIGTLQVEAFEAAEPAAYASMWRILTDFDLTRRIVAGRRPVDEPLRWMLANPRAMRVTRSSDNLWLRILDVQAALEARSYDITGSLVIAVDDAMFPANGGRWRLDVSPGGTTCRSDSHGEVDVAVTIQALSSLYLGAVSPAVLAGSGQIVEARPGALAALHRLFRQDPPPFNAIGF